MDNTNQILEGTHGTTKFRARKIIENGFIPSTGGYRGKGVYFWAGHDAISLELAEGWFKYAISTNKIYDENEDNDFDAICAELHILANRYYDCTHEEFLNKFMVAAKERNVGKDDIAAFYDLFITKIEENLQESLNEPNFSFDVVKTNIPVPKQANLHHSIRINVRGFPSYVVKNNHNEVIKIKHLFSDL